MYVILAQADQLSAGYFPGKKKDTVYSGQALHKWFSCTMLYQRNVDNNDWIICNVAPA